ncbi:MAG: hypothetical protein JOZ05_18740 [Acetobacteraceae bacterium]|nr:hypothetical protein [Acetobacteraceae bacterium]
MTAVLGLDRLEREGVPSAAPVLELLALLLPALDRGGVEYCYWKSAARLGAVLAGDADLDLLIARRDQHRAIGVLLASGFKPFANVACRAHPSVSSYLGYDEPSGRIVHVHVHTRLVSGDRLLRTDRIAWEEAVLRRAVRHPLLPLRLLDPASEAVLLAVRACLEQRAADVVAWRNRRATKAKFAADRARLSAEADRAAVRELAGELLTGETAELLTAGLFGAGRFPAAALRRRVRRELACHRLYGGLEAGLRGAGRAVHWAAGAFNKRRLHAPRPWCRIAPGGGCVVAVLGVDGSGKSTVTRAVRAWLGDEIDTIPMYFGTGDGRPSLLLWPLKLAVPLAGKLLRRKPAGSSHGAVSQRPPGPLYGLLLTVWATALAVEKRNKLLAAHRGAARGLVVVTDRYPQDESPDYNDGPLLPRLPRAPALLRRFEASSYALTRTLRPDLVIVLEAPPALLAQREPSMDHGVIGRRVAALRALTFAGAPIVRVDAQQPLADVLRAVKREVWAVL